MKGDLERSEKASRKVFRRYFPLIFVLWILFVLYPNPLNLIISLQRVFNFDSDPGAVEFMLNDLPSDPVAIEEVVLARIPYRHDWKVYGMPWYCPTIEEVLEREPLEGDCKARALVLASVLEAKNISYQVNYSPTHVWVNYEGKQETPIENDQVNFSTRYPETGERRFQIPKISISFGSGQGDFAQEENCPISRELRCPRGDKIQRTTEAQLIAQLLRLFSLLTSCVFHDG
jgi:hypothetical protein